MTEIQSPASVAIVQILHVCTATKTGGVPRISESIEVAERDLDAALEIIARRANDNDNAFYFSTSYVTTLSNNPDAGSRIDDQDESQLYVLGGQMRVQFGKSDRFIDLENVEHIRVAVPEPIIDDDESDSADDESDDADDQQDHQVSPAASGHLRGSSPANPLGSGRQEN